MEEQEFRKKERRRLLIVASFCLVAIIVIVGYTYSYFVASDTDDTTITGTVASTSLSLVVNKMAPDIDKALVPQLDTAITSAVVGTHGNCVDDNDNAVCQVYEIKVTNTSNVAIKVNGILELNAPTSPNLKWTLIDNYEDGMTTKPNLASRVKAYTRKEITMNETIQANQTKTYYLVIWVSEINQAQNDSGTFTGVVTFKDSGQEITYTPEEVLTNLGLNSIVKTGTPIFSLTTFVDEGIYKSVDDIGNTYYFRGASTKNYVKFGKNSSNNDMYWRIIRINGDGTVRMIYDGTQAYQNGTITADKHLTKIAFNTGLGIQYLGYMYGSSLDDNTTDSTIKDYLDNTWYANTFLNTTYEQYIADAIYCNDRKIDDSLSDDIVKIYKATNRIETTYQPVLTCERKNDRFTLKESKIITTDGNGTNQALKYPVGLITADEVSMAGSVYYEMAQLNGYLYNGTDTWTMTPSEYSSPLFESYIYIFSGTEFRETIVNETTQLAVRPVISLKSWAIVDGTGDSTSPFVVE